MKKRYPEFLPQDKRDSLNEEHKQTMYRLNSMQSLYHATYNEAILDYLPETYRKHAKGKPYEFLCLRLKLFLEGTFSKDKLEALRIAKENFEHYCETMERKNGSQ